MHKRSQQFVLLIRIFIIYGALFRLAQALSDNLARGLRPYAAEIPGSILKLYAVADFIARINLLRLLQRKLSFQIVQPFHHRFNYINMHVSSFPVHAGYYFSFKAFSLFIGGNHGQLYGLYKHFGAYSLFLFQRLQRFYKTSVHFYPPYSRTDIRPYCFYLRTGKLIFFLPALYYNHT